MDEALTTVLWSIGGSVACMVVCVVMFFRADQEAIRLYHLQYSEKHADEERTIILSKKRKQLQWLYGVCALVFSSVLIKNLIVLFS
jgi:hypothetical protein